ncbi:MAG: hypothetical protein Q7262_05040 [Bacteroidales bacterium]|nr:hypothetical protein [Bacteroidales bacterium]
MYEHEHIAVETGVEAPKGDNYRLNFNSYWPLNKRLIIPIKKGHSKTEWPSID